MLYTPLYSAHVALDARIVPFAGWAMPLQFQGILAETRAVRNEVGLFDISHMGRLFIEGPLAPTLLDWILTVNVPSLIPGQAKYTLLCNDNGGIIDDGLIYHIDNSRYMLVCNASNRQQVIEWLQLWKVKRYPDVNITDGTQNTAMIAIQGPKAAKILDRASSSRPSTMRPFEFLDKTLLTGKEVLISRTGYTGEDGFEIICSNGEAVFLWDYLLREGALACGLGARDILRLEACLMLHGNDIDSLTNPLEAGLGRFVNLDKGDFVGSKAIKRIQMKELERKLVGLVMNERNIPRHGCTILADEEPVGQVTSGSYSPTLDKSLGLGYVAKEYSSAGTTLQIEIRDRKAKAQVVALPFYSRRRNK
jgi:aminomethyltransferase